MDLPILDSHKRLTPSEKTLIAHALGLVSAGAGYQVSITVQFVKKFEGEEGTEGKINYHTHNGKVFAFDILVLLNQKPNVRLLTLAHELGHLVDYYTASKEIQQDLGKEDTVDLDTAAGIMFEAEKRAWDRALEILIATGNSSPELIKVFYIEKHKSLETAVEDIYDMLRKEREPKKNKRKAKDAGLNADQASAASDNASGDREARPIWIDPAVKPLPVF